MPRLILAFCLFLVSAMALPEKANAQVPENDKIDSLNKILKTAKEDTNTVKLWLKVTNIARESNPNEALNDGNQALLLAQKIHWQNGAICAYNEIGDVELMVANFPVALENFQKGLNLAKSIGNKQLTATTLNGTGMVYMALADYPKALEQFQQAIAINDEIGNKNAEEPALANIGDLYSHLADYLKALEYLQKALKIDRLTGNKTGEEAILGSIGLVYRELADYPKALIFFQQSLQINRAIGNKYDEEVNLSNIGSTYKDLSDPNKAITYLQQSLAIATEIGDKQGEALDIGQIGNVYLSQSNFPKALENLQQDLKMTIELGDKNGETDVFCDIGNVYEKSGNYSQALDYVQKGLKLAKEIGLLASEEYSYQILTEIYKKMHKPEKTLEAYQQYIVLRDSIMNVDKQKEITRKQMQFDFDEKEALTKAEQDKKDIITKAEIQKDKLERDGFIGGGVFLLLLSGTLFYGYRRNQKQNILLSSQKAAIEARDKEKELLLRELHHRVKNNLQIVSSLLSLQSNQMQDDTSRQAFREGQSRVEAMALIHQRLYLGDKLSTIDIQDYMQNLVRSVSGSYGYDNDKYELVFDVEKLNIDVEIAIPLGLIINEILSNCFKHAFKGIGLPRLEMALQKNGNSISMTISDNGVGMPEEMHSGKAKTFGMRMINSLTKQIRGSLKILNKGGSVFVFHIPLDKNTMEAINS